MLHVTSHCHINPLMSSSKSKTLDNNLMIPAEEEGNTAEYHYVSPPPLSLLSVRRPSVAGLPPDPSSSAQRTVSQMPSLASPNDIFDAPNLSYLPDTDQEETNMPDLTQGLEIKMQDWMGEGVGKMSISPSGRDVVLAARSGLYVIDLEMPLELPRFVPQGGTWDVADVQWNPHPSRGNLVVSTSSEKLLIWNLDRADRSAIQHILSRHYRSITDVNWHNHHPDIVTSTGIDSWIWVWDLRTTGKPVTGLCAFNPGATQVKWNRLDENILASSHGNTLLIWDQRKGAVPLTVVKAHSSRIHGIDWSRTSRREIATCSLDCTIKLWDSVNLGWSRPSNIATASSPSNIFCSSSTIQPAKVIHTEYPVWRSRYVPFGEGVLSLPQRGFRKPELLKFIDNGSEKLEHRSIHLIPEGTLGEGTVKEYVWRVKGGFSSSFGMLKWLGIRIYNNPITDDREFQLVTWNEDRTIRAWPISSATLEEAGFIHGGPIRDSSHRPSNQYISYRNVSNTKTWDHNIHGIGSYLKTNAPEADIQTGAMSNTSPSRIAQKPNSGTATIKRSGTMTKGPCRVKNKRFGGLHALTWMPSVKTVARSREGHKRNEDKESFKHNHASLESSMASLDSFKFGEGWAKDDEDNFNIKTQFSDDKTSEFDPETTSWAEELISAVNGLTTTKTVKISLEKVWSKKRMCRLGLQGPWGESSSVFVRVTFAFPKGYPHCHMSPQIDLEKNHLIPAKRRAMLLRELRLLGKKPPCIDPCLRLLLGLPTDNGGLSPRKVAEIDSESSSEEESKAVTSKGKDLIPLGQGFAEPRTSQGVFSPNGKLVIFSHAPVRVVKNASQNLSASPSASSQAAQRRRPTVAGGLSDAMRRLSTAAQDQKNIPIVTGMDEDLLHALELFSYPKTRQVSGLTTSGESRVGYLVRPIRKSLVSIRDLADVTGLDTYVAKSYAVSGADPASFCLNNANIAKSLNRTDHERIFRTLGALLEINISAKDSKRSYRYWRQDHLSRSIISSFLSELVEKKDVLMLAMVSVALLMSDKICKAPASSPKPYNTLGQLTHVSMLPGKSDSKVKHYRLRASSGASLIAPQLSAGRPTTFSSGLSNSLTPSSSSRSAWMGIANGVRYLVGSQDGQSTPKAHGSPIERSKTLPIVQENNTHLAKMSDGKNYLGDTSQKHSPRFSVSFSLGYHEKELGREAIVGASMRGKRLAAQVSLMKTDDAIHLDSEQQLSIYVFVLAEILFRWGLKQKRTELLGCLPKMASKFLGSIDMRSGSLSIVDECPRKYVDASKRYSGIARRRSEQRSLCTICRLPVNGLSNVCLICCHISHLSCWELRKHLECPLGCGCKCDGGGTFEPLWKVSPQVAE